MTKGLSLANRLQHAVAALSQHLGGADVELRPIRGAVPVVEVSFADPARIPIYVTDAQSQLLCLSYLWRDVDVLPRKRLALLELMLELNPSIPLSSFGRVGPHYVLHGSLSRTASNEDLALELATLSDNARDALLTLSTFLRQ